jgi:type IV pilus assembly protein PilV
MEALIALFVFSVGMLGIAGLQVVAKQNNFDAIQRTTATMLTQDIVERMRANPRALAEYLSNAGETVFDGTVPAMPSPDCRSANCTPAELAQFDLWEWARAINGAMETFNNQDAGGLLLPTACLSGPIDGSAGVYTVTVAWQGRAELSDAAKSANTCGEGRYGADDGLRRLLSIETFILNG